MSEPRHHIVYIAPYEPSRDYCPKAVAVWGDADHNHLIAILRAGLSAYAKRDMRVSIDGLVYQIYGLEE